jgi:hypothetical protein
MAELDSYVKAIGDIISASEKEYFAPYKLDANCDIVKVVSTVSKGVSKVSNETKMLMNEEVGKQVVLLSYLIYRLKFHETRRLDFSNFPAMTEVAEILLLFTEKKNINPSNMKLINKVVLVMSKVDEASMKARYGLGYRSLRLFMLMLLHSSYTNASIVATFILEQLEVV